MGRIIGGVDFGEAACPEVAKMLSGVEAPFAWTHRSLMARPFVQVLRLSPPAEATPVLFEDERGFLLLDGWVCPDNGEAPLGQEALARWLWDLYRSRGPQALCGLNGMYLAVVWDAAHKVLHIANDLLALKPCHFWRHGAEFYFGSQYEPFTKHPGFSKEVDGEALVELLLLGCTLEDHTLFRQVRCLSPGSLLTCDAQGARGEPQARLTWSDQRWGRTTTELIEEMAAGLDRAVRVRLAGAGRTLLPLSGGLDSRALAGFCRRHCRELETLTYGLRKHTDVKVARQIARAFGLPHRVREQGADYLLRFGRLHSSITEGCAEPLTANILPVLPAARGDYNHIVIGFSGGSYHGHNLTHMMEYSRQHGTGPVDSLVGFYTRRWRPAELAACLAPPLRGLARLPGERIRAYFEAVEGPAHVQCFITDAVFRLRHFISCQLNLLEDCARIEAPYTDRAYLDFVLSLPPVALEHKYAFKKMIATTFPEVAHLMDTNTGQPLVLSAKALRSRVRLYLETRRDFLVEAACGRGMRRQSNMWDTFSCVGPDHQRLYHALVRAQRRHLEPFLDLEAVDALFNQAPDPRDPKIHASRVRRLYGLALWFERYFEEGGEPAH